MTERTASCLCGQLTARTRGEPAHVLMCSCAACRAKSGSAFAVSTYWDAAQVMISGESRSWQRPAQEGRTLTYHFCPTCGVALYWRADFSPGHIGIGGGNFPDMEFARPTRAYWQEQCPDWVHHLDQIKRLARQ